MPLSLQHIIVAPEAIQKWRGTNWHAGRKILDEPLQFFGAPPLGGRAQQKTKVGAANSFLSVILTR